MRKRLETMIVLLVAIGVVVAVLLLPFGLALAAPDGKALYDQKCAMCHGGNGVAKEMWAKKGMKNLNDEAWQKANADEAIAKVIAEGNSARNMPAYKDKLSAEEIASVVKQIRSFAPAKP